MAIRIQLRRGTTSEWNTANPTLAEGEIGYNTTLGQFKIGDGETNWSTLDYIINDSSLTTSLGAYIEDSQKSEINGVAELDGSKNILAPASIIFEGTANDYETTLSVTDPTADRTITFPNASGTVALTSDIVAGITASSSDTLTNKSISLTTNTITGTKAEFNSAMSDADFATIAGAETLTNKTLTTPVISSITNGAATLTLPTSTGTIALTTDIPSGAVTETGTQTLTNKTLTSPVISGLYLSDASIVIEGTADSHETTISFTDPTDDRTITFPDASGTVALTSALSSYAALSGATFSGNIAMGTNKITGLGTPTADADAATKSYVDAATAGLNVHASVKAATTTNIALATDIEDGDTLDGVTLATGNRILVKNQTDKTENGVYVVKASGAPDRADDYNTAGEVDAGDFIFVEAGTTNGKTGYVQTNVITTVGSDNIEFTQFSGAGTYSAGTGLTLTGSVFSINTGTTVDLSTSQTLTNKTLTSPIVTGLTLNDSSIVFEGATANDFETTLTVTDPTADRTLTLPDATGTLLSSADFTAKGVLLIGTASGSFSAKTVGTNGQVLTADSSVAEGVKWADASGGGADLNMIIMGAYI